MGLYIASHEVDSDAFIAAEEEFASAITKFPVEPIAACNLFKGICRCMLIVACGAVNCTLASVTSPILSRADFILATQEPQLIPDML
jgi:hypothetical protein